MSAFDLAAIFMALVAAVGWVNSRWLGLPTGAAMLMAGVWGSLAFRLFGAGSAANLIGRVNFSDTVTGYMLAFLLFAGALQVDLGEMRRRRLSIWTLATLGVVVSTVIVGFGVYEAAHLLKLRLSLPWALVFGALISPTDPVAVLATVRRGDLARGLQAILQGESLFNDGVGIVLFLGALAFATRSAAPQPLAIAGSVVLQAGGGLALGLLGGALVVRAMRMIDDYAVEVAVTIALAAGVYTAGHALHVSGAIAAVAAGLLVGDEGMTRSASRATRRYLQAFWTLVDEILNALLFLLLGLETVMLPFDVRYDGLLAVAVPLVLIARLVIVLPWGAYLHFTGERGSSLLLTWGGLRGALSLALALQTPPGPARALILDLTYAVVVFSVVVQGLTFGPLVRGLARWRRPASAPATA